MKTKHIKTGKAEILLVELPESGHDPVITLNGRLGFYYRGFSTYEELPEGNWSILSRANEVTNGNLAGVVKSIPHHIGLHRVYKDYKGKYTFPSEAYVFDTALESLDSLYEANGVYWENPKGVSYTKMPEAEMDYRSFLDWHEAQQNVWDKSRTVILIKK